MILVADRNGNVVHPAPSNGLSAHAVRSVLTDRLALGAHGTSFSGDRDYYAVLGYPRDLTLANYRAKFERDGLAARIVEFPVQETWRDTPTVKEGRDKEARDDTPFAMAWADWAQRLRVYHYCQRVDTLAGIGRYGVLLIGVADGDDLAQEVVRVRGPESIIYLRAYAEDAVAIAEYEDDVRSPRYGLPRIYELSLSDPTALRSDALATRKVRVHWTRCVHVADGALENDVWGRPRLQRVYNWLDDILKLVGGSTEATWKLMRKGFAVTIDEDATLSEEDATAMEAQFDEYDHNLRRFLQLRGATVSDLGSEVVDPTGPFDAVISLISAATGIPKRILLGSERGELASTQDASSWAGRIASRQLNYAEPVILRPLIDRLVTWGALPRPGQDGYTVVWDPLFELDETQRAELAVKWADALQRVGNVMGPFMTLEEFRGEFTPFSEELPPGMVEADATQLAEMVANRGYTPAEMLAMMSAAEKLLSKGAA